MTGGIDYDYQDTHKDARVPEPGDRRRTGWRKLSGLITGLFTMCLVLAVAIGGGFIYLKNEFEKAGPLESDAMVMVNRGEGTRLIAEKLQSQGAISNDRIFLLGLLANQANGKLKAGEYRIGASASMQQIMRMLVAGKSVQYKITIPEGLTTLQILDRVFSNDVLVGEIGEEVAEGSLLPDTYVFTRGATRKDVIERMRTAQDKLLTGMWQERAADLPISSPQEALVLASIVEKETGVASERRRVAGVFVNRLRKKMRLQSDPTIVYGIVGGKGTLGRPIRKSDIAQRTEYNTYQIDGLPPTPIANPGKAAIEAVLNPADTKDLFFVADGTGGHAFAETLEEHNRNVSRWREIERQRNGGTTVDAAEQDALEPQDDTPDQTAALEPDADTPPTDAPPTPQQAPATEQPEAPAEPVADAQNPAADEPDTAVQPAPQAEPAQEPAAEPQAPAISDFAKAILKNAPNPKPKPRVPRNRTEPDDDPQSQVTVTPLPGVPDADAPVDTPIVEAPAPAPQRQAPPSTSDLR